MTRRLEIGFVGFANIKHFPQLSAFASDFCWSIKHNLARSDPSQYANIDGERLFRLQRIFPAKKCPDAAQCLFPSNCTRNVQNRKRPRAFKHIPRSLIPRGNRPLNINKLILPLLDFCCNCNRFSDMLTYTNLRLKIRTHSMRVFDVRFSKKVTRP